MKIYNTLNKVVESVIPISREKVSLYTCGPTVYDNAHIGNLRTYIFEDLLKRSLKLDGFEVNHIMNITDVEDKTIKRASGVKDQLFINARRIESEFKKDISMLNILPADEYPRATEYIEQMLALIDNLLRSGYAYKSEEGSIYFSIAKFRDYGKLSGLDKSNLMAGARVNQDEYSKDSPADFVLWKAWDEADGDVFWEPSTWLGTDTIIGKGRPGWHIECSAMAHDRLGESIDIHAGAVDLIFPHHENEIAQSEARSGKQLARFWVHGEHLLVEGHKMSKSLKNFYTLDDIVSRGFEPLDFRYLCLQAHYRSKLNFTWEGMAAARNARLRLKRVVQDARNKIQDTDESQIKTSKYYQMFKEKIEDDLNTPEALAVVWELARDSQLENDEKVQSLKYLDELVLGLGLFESGDIDIPEEIAELSKRRETAKQNKDYILADKLRTRIESKGFCVEDSPQGSKIVKK